MRTLFILTCSLLFADCFGQEFGVSIGPNFNHNPTNSYRTTIRNGLSASVSYKWYLKDSTPFRVVLAQENYITELSYGQTRTCTPNGGWQSTELSNIALILYPITFEYQRLLEFSLGMQVSTIINANMQGCWYDTRTSADRNNIIDIQDAQTSDYFHMSQIGVNARIAGTIQLRHDWKFVPEYMLYGTPMQEFAPIIGGATIRHYFGFGVSHKFNYTSKDE